MSLQPQQLSCHSKLVSSEISYALFRIHIHTLSLSETLQCPHPLKLVHIHSSPSRNHLLRTLPYPHPLFVSETLRCPHSLFRIHIQYRMMILSIYYTNQIKSYHSGLHTLNQLHVNFFLILNLINYNHP